MKKSSGFSIVGALVAVAIVGVVSTALIKLISDSVIGQKYLDFKAITLTTRLTILEHLSDRANCTASLLNANPINNNGEKDRLISPGGNVLYQTSPVGGITYENGKMRFTRFFFKTGPGVPASERYNQYVVGVKKGAARLTVGVAPTNLNGEGLSEIFFSIPLIVDLNAADGITSCIAVGSDADDVWKLNGFSEIYYMGGNVGIGNMSPVFQLDVTGSIRGTGTIYSDSRIEASEIRATGATGSVIGQEIRGEKFLYTSDARLKENIRRAPGLVLAKQLNGVSFRWKGSGIKSMGFIAQEVEKVLPSAVFTDPETGLKSVDYMQVIPILLESLKELDKNYTELERQLDHEIELRKNN